MLPDNKNLMLQFALVKEYRIIEDWEMLPSLKCFLLRHSDGREIFIIKCMDAFCLGSMVQVADNVAIARVIISWHIL